MLSDPIASRCLGRAAGRFQQAAFDAPASPLQMPVTDTAPVSNLPLDAGVVRILRTFARVTAWVTLAAGLFIVIGWQARMPDLAALYIGTQPVRLASGIAFALGGAALLAASSETPIAQRLRLPLGLVLLVLGALSLIERLGVLDLGLQQWLLVGQAGTSGAAMPVVVSVYFVALGLHAATHCCLRESWINELLALVMLGTAMVALAAQGVSVAAGGETLLSPATSGAAALIFVNAIAWIAVRPASRLCAVVAAPGHGGYIARRLLLPAMLLPLAYSWILQWARGQLGLEDALLIAMSAFVTGASVAGLVWWVARLNGYLHHQRSRVAALDSIAHADALTGLSNRRAFDAVLAVRMQEWALHGRSFALLLIDADRFKAINDDFGHAAGDAVLHTMGQILRRCLRPHDHAARIGGEEFAVLLPDADLGAARLAGERIRSAFAAHPWPQRAITVSIGAAQACAQDSAAMLVARADRALYEAKRGGRDRIVLAAEPAAEGPSPDPEFAA